jgi:hypothetical protein
VDSQSWTAVAAIAGAVSAIAAFAALCFSANQNAQNAAALSLSSAQKFSDECRDLWGRCRESADDSVAYNHCMQDILGSFELFALAVNESALTPRVRDYIVETICDYLDDMVEAGCQPYVQPLTEKQHVCKELKSLAIQHSGHFRHRSEVAEMLNISKSSLP